MSDAVFIHYVICGDCRRQHRIDDVDAVLGVDRVAGVRCCNTVWINLGVALGALSMVPQQDENSAAGMCE